jgi:transcriptional regulator with XRE-family HTH domain
MYALPVNEDQNNKEPSWLGRAILARREAAGWTQKDLEARTGGAIKQAEISRLEKGRTQYVGTEKLTALARAFGVTVEELPTGDQPQMDPGLARLLASEIGADITEEERLELTRTRWANGPAPPTAWYHILLAIRQLKKGSQ